MSADHPAGHHLIHSEAFVCQGEPVASTSEFAPDKPDLTPEQELRVRIAEILIDVDHFAGCTAEPGMTNCPCLIGRLHFAIGTETTTTEGQATS
jgi:hypothetical protein